MLIKTLAEVQEYITVGNGTEFKRLMPHIKAAENAFIKPGLGMSMYEELQEFYDENPEVVDNEQELTAPEAMKELLGKVQNSLIHLAYWMGFQVLNASISDNGFKRSESANLKGLYKYSEDELKEYFKTAGFNAMDDVLEYIELHIEHFNEFKLSPNWTIMKKSFIPSTKILNEIIPINNSRLTFLRLKPNMELVEDIEIMPVLGQAIFDEIKTEMVKDAPADKVKAILPYLRKAIAYFSTSLLMEESGADLTEKGLYFESTTAVFANDKNKQPANSERIALLAARNKNLGNIYLDQLKGYLVSHATEWPQYSGQKGSVLSRDNRDKKTFWA